MLSEVHLIHNGASEEKVRGIIVQSIRDKGGEVRVLDDGAIAFDGPWLTLNNWNPIAILSGVIRVDTVAANSVCIQCRLSFDRFWKIVGGLMIGTLALQCVYLLSPQRQVLLLLMPLSVVLWIVLAGLSRLICTVRMQWFLEKTCARTASSQGLK